MKFTLRSHYVLFLWLFSEKFQNGVRVQSLLSCTLHLWISGILSWSGTIYMLRTFRKIKHLRKWTVRIPKMWISSILLFSLCSITKIEYHVWFVGKDSTEINTSNFEFDLPTTNTFGRISLSNVISFSKCSKILAGLRGTSQIAVRWCSFVIGYWHNRVNDGCNSSVNLFISDMHYHPILQSSDILLINQLCLHFCLADFCV